MIKVDFITRNIGNILTVNYTDDSQQLFDLTMNAISGVFKGTKEYKAKRFTTKYEEAIQTYLKERTITINNEGSNGVYHKIFMVGEIITALKFHNEEMENHVQSYDWSNSYDSRGKLIESTRSSGHQQYNFINVLDIEEEAQGKALEVKKSVSNVIGLNLNEEAKNSLVNSLKRYFQIFKAYPNRLVIDGEKNLHFILETVENSKSEYHVHRYIFNKNTFIPNYQGSFSDYEKAENFNNKFTRGFLDSINF